MQRVVSLAEERGGDDLKWCFKGLECIVTLFFKLGEYEYVPLSHPPTHPPTHL